MNKKILILPVTILGIGLAACQPEEEDAAIATEEMAEEPVTEDQELQDQIDEEEQQVEDDQEEAALNETADKYQSLLDQARREYEAEELDAAAGTLSLLLQNDLAAHSEIMAEGELMKEQIQALQAKNAREMAKVLTEETTYKDERQSSIIAEEYEIATGQSIQEASDKELASWFAQKQISAEKEQESQSWTKEEAENYAFDQLVMIEDLNYKDYFFFVNLLEDDWVQLEEREPVEQDGVTWSNLIGLYRFNVSTDELQKLDIVSGEYQSIH